MVYLQKVVLILVLVQPYILMKIILRNNCFDVKLSNEMCFIVILYSNYKNLRSYSKSKLELESNLSEILLVICKFILDLYLQLILTKLKLEYMKFGFTLKKES